MFVAPLIDGQGAEERLSPFAGIASEFTAAGIFCDDPPR
jgi:hypothetical protein